MGGSPSLSLDGRSLTLHDIQDVAIAQRPVVLCDSAAASVARSRQAVEDLLGSGQTVYGLNTGFGHLANVRIGPEDLATLQINLLRSHAVGVGSPFDIPTTRGLMLLRANVLAAGHSGVRPVVLELLLEMLNRGVHPWIPCQGSVGASGDLAPLAHLALVLVGEGWVHQDGERSDAGPALAAAGLEPVALAPKEGIALINGTQAMTSIGSLVVTRARQLARSADLIGSMTVEGMLASHHPFDPRLHALRPHPGQLAVAANLRRLLVGGTLNASHEHCDKVQDPYSLRCIPQVHGAARQAIDHSWDVLSIEVNSVTDNPTVFSDEGELISGGNFHGQPIATVLDYLAIGIAELGSISERRIEQLVNPKLSSDLPAFLVGGSGLNSGFMMAQVTAAALASENKGLCHPASVDTIPTSAGQEDHVSMGPIAARKAMQVLENTERILAIEAMAASQALDLRQPLVPAQGPRLARQRLRQAVAFLEQDRILYEDLETAAELVRSGALLEVVQTELGELD
ncbi:MAG: histidine ammonia-lyase [Myxococcota bacterium]|nr:histidine ammonia-lyase [Myxococcota bacterium]